MLRPTSFTLDEPLALNQGILAALRHLTPAGGVPCSHEGRGRQEVLGRPAGEDGKK